MLGFLWFDKVDHGGCRKRSCDGSLQPSHSVCGDKRRYPHIEPLLNACKEELRSFYGLAVGKAQI